jgi:hypothetical protein
MKKYSKAFCSVIATVKNSKIVGKWGENSGTNGRQCFSSRYHLSPYGSDSSFRNYTCGDMSDTFTLFMVYSSASRCRQHCLILLANDDAVLGDAFPDDMVIMTMRTWILLRPVLDAASPTHRFPFRWSIQPYSKNIVISECCQINGRFEPVHNPSL